MQHDLTKQKIIELIPELEQAVDGQTGEPYYYPITLADVLRAMKGNVGKYVAVTFDGDFLTKEYGADSWIMEMPAWKLSTDYDGQSDEVKAFIGSLLGI